MATTRTVWGCCVLLAVWPGALPAFGGEPVPSHIASLLTTHCMRCHGAEKARGNVDFSLLSRDEAAVRQGHKTWKVAAEMIARGEMPPEDEPQPTDAERASFNKWYQSRFVSVTAQPGPLRARRLSAVEYRNTLETLFGFPLQVAAAKAQQTKLETSLVIKLLPVDPKGPSGYTNDTSGNPISIVLWENYAYLSDVALLKLFSPEGRSALERIVGPVSGEHLDASQAQRLLERFHARAWRRPVDASATQPHLQAIAGKKGRALHEALQGEMKRIVMSPEFLYRGFLATSQPGQTAPVDSHELAERLSYFLWADMPDAELFAAAAAGELSDPAKLRLQVDRMLKSPKARSLAQIFSVEWLQLDEIDNVTREIPYAAALKGQSLEFFHDLVVQNRPLKELLDSRREFVNPYLHAYYQADRDQFASFTRREGVELATYPLHPIELRQTPGRGGLLTMPGVLIMNPGAIQRGTWVLERILGEHLGDPPPDVPPVKPARPGQKLSFRERFTEHRANKSCAVCHNRIDPLGFAFEAYNEQGGFLLAGDAVQQKVARPPQGGKPKPIPAAVAQVPGIDTSGQLPSGERFKDFEELKKILTSSQWPTVVENLVRQTLAYALCRELELSDEPVVTELTARLSQPGATWGDLLHAITGCILFQQAAFPPAADAGNTK